MRGTLSFTFWHWGWGLLNSDLMGRAELSLFNGNSTRDWRKSFYSPINDSLYLFFNVFKKILLYFFHYQSVPLHPPPPCNHHTVVYVHESFFLFAPWRRSWEVVSCPLHLLSLESIGGSSQRRFFSVSLGFLPDSPKQAREYTYVGINLLSEGSQKAWAWRWPFPLAMCPIEKWRCRRRV